ncbi:MAG: hypothetical protein K8I60_18885 [Anaerolineae bacterium]|nr:hypothetical protein [Anaerolineae bacterium]
MRHKRFVASTIWNHFIALQRRYYRLTGKYVTLNQMNNRVLRSHLLTPVCFSPYSGKIAG